MFSCDLCRLRSSQRTTSTSETRTAAAQFTASSTYFWRHSEVTATCPALVCKTVYITRTRTRHAQNQNIEDMEMKSILLTDVPHFVLMVVELNFKHNQVCLVLLPSVCFPILRVLCSTLLLVFLGINQLMKLSFCRDTLPLASYHPLLLPVDSTGFWLMLVFQFGFRLCSMWLPCGSPETLSPLPQCLLLSPSATAGIL